MRPKCTGGKKGFLFSILAAAAMVGSVAFPAFGDDSDIFKIQATPNVLLILDDSGSMARTYGGSEVGDLDGEDRAQFQGTGTEVSSRVDVAYRVLYQLLNADKTEVTIGATNYAYPEQRNHVFSTNTGDPWYQFDQNITSTGDENALRFR
ncbi:MAG: hypothetical protein E4G97_04630, partial [Deltaproteobacteria bacterium]